MCYRLIRSILFQFDAEKSHHFTLKVLHYMPTWLARYLRKRMPRKPVSVLGLDFPNPVGLAAGFDKDGLCIDALLALGFGFIEVGTVTPRPQPGNPKPRLFRIEEQQALINRMGFNNLGVDHLVERLKKRTIPGIVGANIGKNKDTPLESAADDYCICLRKLYKHVDFIVINVSSPNTPGLRNLQKASYFDKLLEKISQQRENLIVDGQNKKPLLIKIVVDLSDDDLKSVVNLIEKHKVDGVISSNTSVNHSAVAGLIHATQAGGLSGKPLAKPTCAMIKRISDITDSKLPIISIGGIATSQQANDQMQAGAKLVEIYTGLVYKGPSLIKQICKDY